MEEGTMAAFDFGGIAQFEDGVEVANHRQHIRIRGGRELVAMDGTDPWGMPFRLVVLAAVMVAGDTNHLGKLPNGGESIGDQPGFVGTGMRRVDDVTEEDELGGPEVAAKRFQTLASPGIGKWPKFAAAALRPGKAEMEIGEKCGSLPRQPKGARGVEFNHPTPHRWRRRTHRRRGPGPAPAGFPD